MSSPATTQNDADDSLMTTSNNRLPRLQSLINAIYDRYSDLSSNCCDNICSSNVNSANSNENSNNSNSEEQTNFSSTSESSSTAGSPMNNDVSGSSGCGPILTSSINDISFYMPICFSPRKTSMFFH
jgi:hypothetical protein